MLSSTRCCYILNVYGFREDFLSFPHNKPMRAIDPQVVASFDPRDMLGRINVEDHEILQHTKYISCGPHGFQLRRFFKDFPIMSMGALLPSSMATRVPIQSAQILYTAFYPT